MDSGSLREFITFRNPESDQFVSDRSLLLSVVSSYLDFLRLYRCLSHAQTADELIAKNIEARGGLERIKAIKTIRVTGKINGFVGLAMPYLLSPKSISTVPIARNSRRAARGSSMNPYFIAQAEVITCTLLRKHSWRRMLLVE